MDQAVAGDETVTVDHLFLHPEIGAAVTDQLIHLLERAFVDQEIDALARRQFAFFVLLGAAFFAAPRLGDRMPPPQFIMSRSDIRH